MPRSKKQNSGNNKSDGFCIVGIGASAGGVEAFTGLLKALAPDLGMAYILVPHLDPSRESAFTEILARATRMPVVQVTDGMAVELDHVYVIPPNREMTISGMVLYLKDRELPRTVSVTIDTFLRSLAENHGRNAIGVILSGTGSDGTFGLTAVKAEGGITFAQDADTAKYDSMPASAISSGHVDFVLSPEGIAEELGRIARHVSSVAVEVPEAELDATEHDSQMTQVFRLLRRNTRVDFSGYKAPTIERRIRRRMALHKFEKLSEYTALLHRDRDEVIALYQDLLINVTSFFRNPDAFDTLKQVVYPQILAFRKGSANPIGIWVPGCSTGEEAYSHAISLVEFLSDERVDVPIQIFGTDLSEAAIAKARAGLYKENVEADVTPVRLRRFFQKHEAGYQISKTIRDLCIFSTQNIFSDPPFSRMDMVSCRNVMIYLGQSLQKRVIPIFHYALNATGFLMIGNTEGLLGAGTELFELVDKKQKVYRKKLVPTPVNFGFTVEPRDYHVDLSEAQARLNKPSETMKTPADLQREADRLLLARYAPPSVVVNDQLEIIQTKGHTSRFLELPSGKASLNLLKMSRPGLLFDLRDAIEEARKSSVEAVRSGVHVEANGDSFLTTIRVLPFKTPIQDHNSFLVVFEPEIPEATQGSSALGPSAPTLTDDERRESEKQFSQLKQELAATKEYLQAIIESQEATNEELQSANEEIQSGNEELQSTNEELQTSKEELESANEELHTVNEEMQHRNEMLSQLNNDLVNLLNSVNLPLVMVSSDLSVRRFTPQAADTLGLVPSDVGRPIPRLKLKVEVNDLERTMLEVLKDVQPRQYRVKDSAGGWCTFRFTPYRTVDNRVDGVVLSVMNLNDTGDLPGGNSSKPKRKNKKAPKKGTQAKRRSRN